MTDEKNELKLGKKRIKFELSTVHESMLNNHITEQNDKGWVLKSITTTTSAIEIAHTSKYVTPDTGLILVWEKEENGEA